MRLEILIVLCFLGALVVSKTSYHGFQVLEFSVGTQSEAETLVNLVQEHPERLSLWNENIQVPGKITIQIAPTGRFLFENLNIPHSVVHEDLQDAIDESFAINEIRKSESDNFFDAYATYDEMQAFLKNLADTYPALATLVRVGTSLENRAITGIVITGKPQEDRFSKPAIVMNALQHAREWISPMTVAYIAQQFLEDYETDNNVKRLVDFYSWTIIPMVNPDGYVFSWTNDRMWRKNRRYNPNSSCYGVDTNRNWAYQWGTGGSSDSPCSDTYMGPSPFSEPEETSVANYIASLEDVVGYIDFHAYGDLFMYPWGYTCSSYVANNATQDNAGLAFASAVQSVNGLVFTVGPVCQTIYQASGGSNDWTFGSADVPFSYACELRGNSFILPPDQILPSGEEIWAGVKALGNYLLPDSH